MRWILHIGAPKTGSTAIQRFLSDNRAGLTKHGILYPDVSLRGFGHHDLAFLLHGRYPEWATPQSRPLSALRLDLGEQIKSNPNASAILLSSENFYLYPEPGALKKLLMDAGLQPTDDVTIVCYARRQDEAHLSWYNQTVKAQGSVATFAQTVENTRALWAYAEQLQSWRSVFGDKAIIVRDYTPFNQPEYDIRIDFLDVLGLPHDVFPLPTSRINERINRDILDFQRWINRLPLSAQKKRRFHKQLIDLTKASASKAVFDDTPFMSSAQRRSLVESYATDNARLAKTYLGKNEIFAPVESDHQMHSENSARQGLTLTKILRILAWISFRRG